MRLSEKPAHFMRRYFFLSASGLQTMKDEEEYGMVDGVATLDVDGPGKPLKLFACPSDRWLHESVASPLQLASPCSCCCG